MEGEDAVEIDLDVFWCGRTDIRGYITRISVHLRTRHRQIVASVRWRSVRSHACYPPTHPPATQGGRSRRRAGHPRGAGRGASGQHSGRTRFSPLLVSVLSSLGARLGTPLGGCTGAGTRVSHRAAGQRHRPPHLRARVRGRPAHSPVAAGLMTYGVVACVRRCCTGLMLVCAGVSLCAASATVGFLMALALRAHTHPFPPAIRPPHPLRPSPLIPKYPCFGSISVSLMGRPKMARRATPPPIFHCRSIAPGSRSN